MSENDLEPNADESGGQQSASQEEAPNLLGLQEGQPRYSITLGETLKGLHGTARLSDLLLPTTPSLAATSLLGLGSLGLSSVNSRAEELTEEISAMRKERRSLLHKLGTTEKESAEYREAKAEVEQKNVDLERKMLLSYILPNVCEAARQKMLDSEEFRSLFENSAFCNSFVLSIDIRRSTELMLKAREARRFAEFIIQLCSQLSRIVINNYGVFDKFTGDGVLAFFPDFYSGKDGGLLAIKAALECHRFFAEHYRSHRNCFSSVLSDCTAPGSLDTSLRDRPAGFRMRFLRHSRSIIR